MNAPVHTCELAEAHEVSVPIPVQYLSAAAGALIALGGEDRKRFELARSVVWSACRREALAWLKANAVEAEVDVFTAGVPIGGFPAPDGGEPRWGARFSVVVGRGASSQSWSRAGAGYLTPDELLPDFDVPAVDNWTYSERWRDWLDTFSAMEAGPDRAAAHLAAIADGSVIDMHHPRSTQKAAAQLLGLGSTDR